MIEQKVRNLIEKKVNELGVNIDSDEGIDVDKCVEVTNLINPLLDEADLISDSYILDISSKERGE